MALPLLTGIAIGSLAVIAFNNKKEIKERVVSCASKAKDLAKTSFKKSKEYAKDAKDSVIEKIDSMKSKEQIEVAK